jgi:hypothetical protein
MVCDFDGFFRVFVGGAVSFVGDIVFHKTTDNFIARFQKDSSSDSTIYPSGKSN